MKRERFVSEFGLPEYDADLLTSEKSIAGWFGAVKAGGQAKAVSNWMMGELMKLLNEENKNIRRMRTQAFTACRYVKAA